MVVFILRLREHTAAVTRAAPLPLGAQGSWRRSGARDKSQKVPNFLSVHWLRPTVALVDSNDVVKSAVALLLEAVGQR